MGLFGDLDVAAAEDNPWDLPANTYEAAVFEVAVKENKDKTKKGLSITYKVTEGEHTGKKVSEWKTIPEPANPKAPSAEDKQAASFLKMRLASLGVPESRMNSVDVNDLQGLDVFITVKKNGEYTNVTNVKLGMDDDAVDARADSFGAPW